MKQFLSLAALVLLSFTVVSVNAQDTIKIVTQAPPPPHPTQPAESKTQLNLYGMYVFDDHVEGSGDGGYYFSGKVKGGFLGGIGLQFNLRDNYGLELLYMRQDTHVDFDRFETPNNPSEKPNPKLTANYVMLAGVKSVKTGNKAEPYGGIMLGANFLNLESDGDIPGGSATKFAWGIRGGVNIWASERVGIKLQAQLLSSVQGVGGGIYLGTGGAGAGVSTYSSVLQLGLGGGLSFRFGK
jgi:hypothetical protein